MGGTDTAFIKAFAQRRNPAVTVAAAESVTPPVGSSPATATPNRPIVSQFLTSATIGMGTESASGPSPRSTMRRHLPHPILPPHGSLAAIGSAPMTEADTRVSTRDRGHVTTRLDPSERHPIAPPHRAHRFRPQWEVDAFAFPSVCDRLQSESSQGLANLLRSVLEQAWSGRNIFAVTSCSRGEGVTTVTLCIARMAAAAHVRVAVLDGNLESPTIGSSLNLQVERGWLASERTSNLAESAIGAERDALVIFPLCATEALPTQEPPCALASQVLQTLGGAFDLVLLDAGPMYQAARLWYRPEVCLSLHASLIVRDIRNTSGGQIDDVCHRVRDSGVRDVAVIHNFENSAMASHELGSSCTKVSGI